MAAARAPLEPGRLLQHAEAVRSLARALTGDAQRADDLVQDACLAAIRTPPRAGTPHRAWFVRVVRNLAARTLRDEARRSQRERAAARPEHVSGAADVAAEIEAHRLLVEAVAALAEPYRSAIVLRYFDGLAPAEIAARRGVRGATARSWIHRGLAMLRARLAPPDDERRGALLVLLARPDRSAAARASAASLPSSLVAGGLAMAAKKTAAVALALLLLLAGGAVALRSLVSGDARSGGSTETSASDAGSAVRGIPPRAAIAAGTAPDDLPPPVDLATVDRDLDLHGVVVDRAGAPVAGAEVSTCTMPWRRTRTLHPRPWETVEGPATRSAADGTFRLRLTAGALVHVRAEKPGVGEAESPACQAGERVRMVLEPAVTLVVTTVDAAGAPVAGTGVRVVEFGRPIQGPDRTGTTDASGACSIGGLRPGAIVNVGLEPLRLAAPAWTRVELPGAGSAPVRVVLGEGRTLRGRVTGAATSAPIAGARVALGSTLRHAVTTDARGVYELRGCPLDGYSSLVCVADGHASGHATIGADDTIDFALAPGDRVAGRIVGHDGAPVAGALLSVIGRDTADGREVARHATSEADGRFTIADLAHDQPHMLIAIAEGHARTLIDFDPPPGAGEVRDLGDIRLAAACRARGRIVAADGSGAAGVEVRLFGSNDDEARRRPGHAAVSDSYGHEEVRRTDDLGRFAFPDLAPGRYTLTAMPVGGRQVRREVTVPAGGIDDVEVRLGGGESFTLTVVDDEGAPVAGALVSVFTADLDRIGRTTGTDGRAVFTPGAAVTSVDAGLAPGGRPFLETGPRRVEEGATEVRIVVTRAERITGSVVGPDGRAIGQAMIEATCDGRPFVWTWGAQGPGAVWTGWSGRFEVLAPRGKAVDLVLTGFARSAPQTMAGRPGVLSGELRGVAAGTRDVVLRAALLPSDRDLSVLVLDPDGLPLPGAEVSLSHFGTAVHAPVVSGLRGRAAFAGVPGGKLSVAARLPDDDPHRGDWLEASASGVVPAGQEISIRFRAARRVSGVVLAPDGTPLEGAAVALWRDGRPFSRRTSGPGGRFAVPAPLAAEGDAPLYLWVSHRPGGDCLWEHRDAAFRPPDEDLTVRLAAVK